MDKIELRRLSKLDYREPVQFLIELRKFEIEVALSQTPELIRNLRTNSLKSVRELRDAAIFCYLMGERLGTTVYLSPVESDDYDFVTFHQQEDTTHYSKVQLKELTSTDSPGSRTLKSLIFELKKYGNAPELCVAIHLNRRLQINPLEISMPQEVRGIGSIWMFGAISPDQSKWGFWGNLLESQCTCTSHEYPQ